MRLSDNSGTTNHEALNPIFEYAAKGQHHENRKQWDLSVHWYRRALACLPNLFGVDKKIQPLDVPDRLRVRFKSQHASRIYAALGKSLKALGYNLDSHLAFRAAAALDPEERNFFNIPGNQLHVADSESANEQVLSNGPDDAGTRSGSDLQKKLTLMMVTHCTRPLKKYASLSPPSNKLVTATYGSMLNVFGEEIAGCPKVMCYDVNPNGTDRDAQYSRSIEIFSRENGFALTCFKGAGLFNVLHRTIQSVTTPYVFFVEHDWIFRGEQIQLPTLIEMMEDEPRINAIRFNKRQNYLDGQDFIMTVDSAPRRYPLMGTSSYSNNPSIIRTEKLKSEWLPVCHKSLSDVANRLGGSAFGVEEILFKKYVQDIRAQGFQKAHENWGTYVFGRVGDGPRISHLGE